MNLEKSQVETELKFQNQEISCLKFSSNSSKRQFLASASLDKTLVFYNLKTFEMVKKLQIGLNLRFLNWADDGKFIFGVSETELCVWKCEEGEKLGDFEFSEVKRVEQN